MIEIELDIYDTGLLCIVLNDVIKANTFVDDINEQLQKIHDKLKSSIDLEINTKDDNFEG